MKTVLLLLLSIGLLMFASCNNQDPEPQENNQSVSSISYELDGVLQDPKTISFSLLNNSVQFVALDTSMIAIAIMFDSLNGEGVYQLPDSNIYDLNYLSLTVDSKIYHSSLCNERFNNNARFEITEIDYTNNLISGTFQGRVGNYNMLGDSTEHEITNGIFTNIQFID